MPEYRPHDVEAELRKIAANGDGKLKDAAQTLFRMPDDDRRVVVEVTARLANSIPKVGPGLAFEIVAATARRIAKDGGNG